ncbi:hypothetical protein FGD71_000380 [Streptomyces sporangiiformans]|uniref:Uncharacterized protein n=1 Tax=Streptomyces sporangiiformans TaxID=2315329 RepID=A0A505DS11_9ACTN|nr:hypothetical protein FGD71_000380 [Streptomyces sporangiiformans]
MYGESTADLQSCVGPQLGKLRHSEACWGADLGELLIGGLVGLGCFHVIPPFAVRSGAVVVRSERRYGRPTAAWKDLIRSSPLTKH